MHPPPGSTSPVPEHLFPLPTPSWTTDPEPAGSEEWSAVECVRTLCRRKAALVWITCFGILAAALVTLMQPRMYQSQASLEIQGVNENFLNPRDIYPTAAPSADAAGTYVQTQAEILQQDALIEQVVRKLGLEGRQEFQGSPMVWEKSGTAPAERNAVETVKKNLEIVPLRGSRIIRIIYSARDPQVAADLVNTLGQTFIEESIEARQHAARQTHDTLRLQLQELRNKLLKLEAQLGAYRRGPGELTSYNMLKREVDANRQFYQVMSERVNDAGAASAVRQSNIRLIGPAEPASHPYKPSLPLNLAIGTFGGLVLAVGCVMLREQTNSVLRAPGDAGLYLNLPELGAIPRAANHNTSALRFLSSSNGKSRLERAGPEQRLSGLSESFRATLASILSASRKGDHPRIFVVTSAGRKEGKTTVVSNLGIAMAEISGRVLLIDGDMRYPRLHKLFDQANSWGLSDILREKNAIEGLPVDVLVKKTAVPHLYLLPSGACTDNVFGLLCSGRMERLLPRFREEFDYVLVDAPPCLEFADARIMAHYAETLLLIVRANYTDRKMAQAAIQRLLLDGISLKGVILNDCDPAHGDKYGNARYNGFNGRGLV